MLVQGCGLATGRFGHRGAGSRSGRSLRPHLSNEMGSAMPSVILVDADLAIGRSDRKGVQRIASDDASLRRCCPFTPRVSGGK